MKRKKIPACLKTKTVRPTYRFASRSERPGAVYLAESLGSPGVFKVGATKNVKTRLANLHLKTPVRLVWCIETNQATWLERHVMLQWSDCHVDGEWFRPAPEQVAWFQRFSEVNWKGVVP